MQGDEYAYLTNIIHEEWSGLTEAELIFTALAELSTRQIAETEYATVFSKMPLRERKVASR